MAPAARLWQDDAPPDRHWAVGGRGAATMLPAGTARMPGQRSRFMIARVAAVAVAGGRDRRGGAGAARRRLRSYTLQRGLPGRRRAGHRQRRADRPGQGRVGAVDLADAERPGAGDDVASTRARRRCTRARWRGSTRTRCRGSPTSTSCSSPAPAEAPAIPDGGTIGEHHTYSFVSLDQLFDALDPLTRAGLRERHPGRGGEHRGQGGPGIARRSSTSPRGWPARAT